MKDIRSKSEIFQRYKATKNKYDHYQNELKKLLVDKNINQCNRISRVVIDLHQELSLLKWILNDDIQEPAREEHIEAELITRFFSIPEWEDLERVDLTATAIKNYIEEKTDQKINIWWLGTRLKAIGFKQKAIKINRKSMRVYEVVVKKG